MKKEVLLYSSGLDSYLAREYLISEGHDFDCLYFYHNGRYCDNELEILHDLPFSFIVKKDLNFKNIEEEDAFIPNRNILMTTMANSYGYDNIWIGGSKSDRVCDNNREIFNRHSEFLSTMNERGIKISSPFWDVYKSDVIKWFNERRKKIHIHWSDIAGELLYHTFSCFNPRELTKFSYTPDQSDDFIVETEECLNCKACFRKSVVLAVIGIYRPFYNGDIVESYWDQYNNMIISNPRMIATRDYIMWLKSRG